ncbi:YgiW/YdeI family stress tolerance OB fold protein [Xenorhabdus sp. DI]|uniref:YgiW/YdeI family stress tolerance OB fold protein n=1 Tax=Xenorhabdus doucetiae TaxID=351671 RepID=UPI0019BBD774|nr:MULTISPECIES: YgiW/YdeI family stress tolerance OB fold protein [unclassified Xenorhabdus]MBD2786314.1 YgiW/YdeI family stress tolerance OB fold protein [Xenorhabdus sp. 3]MBD2788930.1 YgiW/YdeI family stress tolerance OB fold protein [Xenorhabdus sp. DI]MBD2798382.1 YgiW/YdeI family stress tolerance OB fold protein [Xenorhabdus sp. 18]
MKKTLSAIILSILSFGALAQQGGFASSNNAENYSQGGFKGPTPSLTSVAQAKSFRDDSWVVLEGNIVKQVGHELYEFRDNSGSVYIDIDDKIWMGQTVTPADKIRIEGEVDKDWNSIEIDVKTIHVVK